MMRKWLFYMSATMLCVWLLVSCSVVKNRSDSREVALLALWTLAEQELGQAVLSEEEVGKVSNAIETALNLCEDDHSGTFVSIMEASSLPKEKFDDAYKLAAVMDLFFTVELREEYRDQLRKILLSLQKVIGER